MNENSHRIRMPLLKYPWLFGGLLAHLLDERFYDGETRKGADQQSAAVSPFWPTPCSVNRRGVR